MKSTKRILVMTDHMPWGHRSIAMAIFNYLKQLEKSENWKVDYEQVYMDTGMGNDFYALAYRYFPQLNRLTHQASHSKTVGKLLELTKKQNMPRIKKLVDKYKPDLVISTYFWETHFLADLRDEQGYNYKLWTVVADPWTINGVSLTDRVDLNLVYDEVVEKIAHKKGINKDKVLACGWWTREEMYERIAKQKAREKIGLKGDYPVIFIGGGSLGGANYLTKILPLLPFVSKEVGIIFNCGTDKMSYRLIDNYSKLLDKITKKVHIINLGWIEKMNEALAAADIVFGKAGPNFLFDSVAQGKPFVAITHIYGQEDGNLAIIKKKKLGWVKEKPLELNGFFLNYIKNPEKYNKLYRKTIEAEAERNKKSLEKIKEEIKKNILPNVGLQ